MGFHLISYYVVDYQTRSPGFRMVVAVRLLEVLVMITIIGIMGIIASIVVTFERFLWIFLVVLRPIVYVLDYIFCVLEYVFLVIIENLVSMTDKITSAFWAEHPFQWYYDMKDSSES